MDKVRFQVIEKDGHRLVEEIHKVVVHRFIMSDVEEPDLYAAQPIYEWQGTDPGKFVMEHALDKPEFHKMIDHQSLGWKFVIVAELELKKLSEFYLRWGKP